MTRRDAVVLLLRGVIEQDGEIDTNGLAERLADVLVGSLDARRALAAPLGSFERP